MPDYKMKFSYALSTLHIDNVLTNKLLYIRLQWRNEVTNKIKCI